MSLSDSIESLNIKPQPSDPNDVKTLHMLLNNDMEGKLKTRIKKSVIYAGMAFCLFSGISDKFLKNYFPNVPIRIVQTVIFLVLVLLFEMKN